MNITDQYYHSNSQLFFDSTVNADVSSLYERFIRFIPAGGRILDLGCGSGRDTKAFLSMGYFVDAIDGSSDLCKLASEYTGIAVKCMDFMELSAIEEYDAIWACASLLHAPSDSLPIILSKMYDALKPTGIMYISFKYGEYEGERDGRYFTDMTSDSFLSLLAQVPSLVVVEEWYSEDVRPEKSIKWYNVIVRRV